MTERQAEPIVEKLKEAEALVLSAMQREPKNYDLHDSQTAIWKAIDAVVGATNE